MFANDTNAGFIGARHALLGIEDNIGGNQGNGGGGVSGWLLGGICFLARQARRRAAHARSAAGAAFAVCVDNANTGVVVARYSLKRGGKFVFEEGYRHVMPLPVVGAFIP